MFFLCWHISVNMFRSTPALCRLVYCGQMFFFDNIFSELARFNSCPLKYVQSVKELYVSIPHAHLVLVKSLDKLLFEQVFLTGTGQNLVAYMSIYYNINLFMQITKFNYQSQFFQ